jgi:hypothetical protein
VTHERRDAKAEFRLCLGHIVKRGQQKLDPLSGCVRARARLVERYDRIACRPVCASECSRQIIDLRGKDGDGAAHPFFKVRETSQPMRQNQAIETSAKRARDKQNVGNRNHSRNLSVQNKFHDQEIAHTVPSDGNLNAAQHLGPQPGQRRRIIEVTGFNRPEIAVHDIDDPRLDGFDFGKMFGRDLDLGSKPQETTVGRVGQIDDERIKRNEGDGLDRRENHLLPALIMGQDAGQQSRRNDEETSASAQQSKDKANDKRQF